SSTAYPRATISHGFHRQDQQFQLDSGPPWIHSSNGAGSAADASPGRHSQARSGTPSSATVVTSTTEPGSSSTRPGLGRNTGCRSAGRGVGGNTGCWSAADGSSRTGSGGLSTADRSAYSAEPSWATARSLYAPDAVNRVTDPSARSNRNAGRWPWSSATKNTAALSAENASPCGQNGNAGVASRPSPVSRSISHSVQRAGSSYVVRPSRTQASQRPSGENAGSRKSPSPSSTTSRRSPSAVPATTTVCRWPSGPSGTFQR